MLQSSDISNEQTAKELSAGFLNKYSKNLSNELHDFIINNFGFGDFVFRDPDTLEKKYVASDLKDLQQLILTIPDNVFIYHTNRDDLSKWLNARALFPIAQIFKPTKLDDFKCIDDARKYIFKTISNFRSSKAKGIIAEFNKHLFDEYLSFSRIGEGSIGGKARGLAFVNTIIKKEGLQNKFNDVVITVPRTVVLSTEVFEEFMEKNNLYEIGLSEMPDDKILYHFVHALLPGTLKQDLRTIISKVKNPLAVRSSSKLEDSYFQPFAGIYNTYMLPIAKDENAFLQMLENAIKCVYASVYFQTSKSYISATANVLDEEKMGIIIQEVCGNSYENRFYPTLSGVARSINYYPIYPEKSGEGIANLAYGLGRLIMGGGISLRFSPKYPKKILQLSSPEMAIKNTQRYFYALDLDPGKFVPSIDDKINLLKVKIKDATDINSLKYAASIYDAENGMVREGINYPGNKIITFSPILVHKIFPLAEIIDSLLEIGQKEINNPVEIEFAVNLDTPEGKPKVFNFLQIRPIVAHHREISFEIENVDTRDTIIYSEKAMGNGRFENISNMVYVKPGSFNSSHSKLIAKEIEKLNLKLINEKKNYVLIGPGRWGSSDPWLGIPVKWAQISGARIIIESGLKDYMVDPSQGSHFFHNLTTFGVGYMALSPHLNDGYYDTDYLKQQKHTFETNYLRLISFKKPLRIEIDGRSNKGVVYKPI